MVLGPFLDLPGRLRLPAWSLQVGVLDRNDPANVEIVGTPGSVEHCRSLEPWRSRRRRENFFFVFLFFSFFGV